MKSITSILSLIASNYLHIPTLETRRSDQLDFYDVAVWQVEAALKAAFDAGRHRQARHLEQPVCEGKATQSESPSTALLVQAGEPLVSGKMYLRLYHGRNDPRADMEDWGLDGPTFGPLSCYVHTYCSTFRIHGEADASELWLEKHEDMIRWDGSYFGDFEVFVATDTMKG